MNLNTGSIPKHKFILPTNFVFLVKINAFSSRSMSNTAAFEGINFSSKILCWLGV